MKKTLKKAFTLIELVIVIVVIGVLAAIIIPSVSDVGSSSKAAAAAADLKNVSQAVGLFMQQAEEWPVDANNVPIVTDDVNNYYSAAGTGIYVASPNPGATAISGFRVMAINFDKLTKPYVTKSGKTVGPFIQQLPKTSFYTNPTLTPATAIAANATLTAAQGKNVQARNGAYIYAMDEFARVYLVQDHGATFKDSSMYFNGSAVNSAAPTTDFSILGHANANSEAQKYNGTYFVTGDLTARVK